MAPTPSTLNHQGSWQQLGGSVVAPRHWPTVTGRQCHSQTFPLPRRAPSFYYLLSILMGTVQSFTGRMMTKWLSAIRLCPPLIVAGVGGVPRLHELRVGAAFAHNSDVDLGALCRGWSCFPRPCVRERNDLMAHFVGLEGTREDPRDPYEAWWVIVYLVFAPVCLALRLLDLRIQSHSSVPGI